MRCSQNSDSSRHSHAVAGIAVAFAPRLGLVDANPATRTLLVDFLRDHGFDVVEAGELPDPLPPVDALVLALDATAAKTRRAGRMAKKLALPVIVLERPPLFPGLSAPARFAPDARLAVPVPPRKLVATIRQVLSLARVEGEAPETDAASGYRFGAWTLDCGARRLESASGASVRLSKTDFEVLQTLLRFPRQVLTRRQLIDSLWGAKREVEGRALDAPITRLRRHLGEDVRFPRLIRTVVGVGYRLDADVEAVP